MNGAVETVLLPIFLFPQIISCLAEKVFSQKYEWALYFVFVQMHYI